MIYERTVGGIEIKLERETRERRKKDVLWGLFRRRAKGLHWTWRDMCHKGKRGCLTCGVFLKKLEEEANIMYCENSIVLGLSFPASTVLLHVCFPPSFFSSSFSHGRCSVETCNRRMGWGLLF